MVRALGVSPAEMQPHPVRRYALQSVVDDLHVQLDDLDELVFRQMRELGHSGHGQVRTVYLQQQARFGDGLIFVLHHVGQGVKVCFLGGVEIVGQEIGDDSGGSRCHEKLFRLSPVRRGFQAADVPLDGGPITPGDGPGAGRLGDVPGGWTLLHGELGKVFIV